MPVDASAVSRIEKGNRSVRLTEAMIIADTLDEDLSFLMGIMRSPSQDIQARRRAIDSLLHDLRFRVKALFDSIADLTFDLSRKPELLAYIADDNAGKLETAAGYPQWIAERVERWDIDPDTYTQVATKEEVEGLTSLVLRIAEKQVGTADLPPGLEGQATPDGQTDE